MPGLQEEVQGHEGDESLRQGHESLHQGHESLRQGNESLRQGHKEELDQRHGGEPLLQESLAGHEPEGVGAGPVHQEGAVGRGGQEGEHPLHQEEQHPSVGGGAIPTAEVHPAKDLILRPFDQVKATPKKM